MCLSFATFLHSLQSFPSVVTEDVQANEAEFIEAYDVLVLGAGMAGLGAAYRLKESNTKFFVLEAQSQPGGRINAQYMQSSDIVNAGAQWLHGRQNLLYRIASEHDLIDSKISEEAQGSYFRVDGSKVDEFLVKKIDFKVGQILEECEKFAEQEGHEYPKSVEVFLKDNFAAYLQELPEDEQQLAKELYDYHIRFHIIDNSTLSLNDVSAKDWGTYSFNGESCQAHINFKNSFNDLINVIANDLGDVFAYNTIVDQLCWGTSSAAADAKVLVRCKDGRVYQAKQVIVTFSLGVLKERPELFHPELPLQYRELIECFGFGTINKIFLQFDEAWWGKDEGIQIVYDDDDLNEKDAHWTRFMSGFDLLQPGAKNTLLGWVGGPGALKMEELEDAEVVEDCLNVLKQFTGMNVPSPKAYYVTRWHSNEFIRGSYSYVSSKCDAKNLKPSDLTRFITYEDLKFQPDVARKPEDAQPLVLFAGEACHDQYYSTAHGAFHSGVETAEKLLNFSRK